VRRREEGTHFGTLVDIKSIDVETGHAEVCGDSDGQDAG
jgi:hypothetical protein